MEKRHLSARVAQKLAVGRDVRMAVKDDDSMERIRVRRGRVDSFTTYDVTEWELEALKQGAPASLLLNFAIASLSVCITLVVTLVTVTITTPLAYAAFIGSTIATGGLGMALFIYWWRTYRGIDEIVGRIQARLPPTEADVPRLPEAMQASNGAEQSPDADTASAA